MSSLPDREPARLHFSLFGDPCVTVEGVETRLALPRRAIVLLAFVLLSDGGRLSRERLATTLWPDDTEQDGRGKLRRMLYCIARSHPEAASGEWLAVDATTVCWNQAIPRTLDVEVLRDALATTDLDPTSLYRGDLLSGYDDEWIVPERERLRTAHVARLERFAKRSAADGRYAAARAALVALLAIEPWREDVMRLAIEASLALGEGRAARNDYEAFTRRLRETFGIEPMPATLALGRQPASPHRRGIRSFVGRERELAMLAERFGEAEDGRGGLVLIGGESGVGKTALLAKHARTVEERHGSVVTASTRFVSTRPYQPFAAALRHARSRMGEARVTPGIDSALKHLLGEDAAFAHDRHGSEREETRNRERLFEGVAECFAALCLDGPLLLVIEDVHWAGGDTIALLEFVTRRAARSPLSIVATYRDGEMIASHPLRGLRRRLQDEPIVAHLLLAPLQSRDVQRWCEARGSRASHDVADRFHAASGGLPILLEGLVDDALALTPSDAEIAVPATLPVEKMSALTGRVAALPADVRALLEIAAVTGLGFDVELVVEVSGWSEAETQRTLAAAIEHGVVRESGRGAYDFSHDLFRVIAYEAVPNAVRTRRHALVAEALEQLHPDLSDELAGVLALHYERAGDVARAAGMLRSAARRASRTYAHDEAVAYLERALALTNDARERFELLLLREEARRYTGDPLGRTADLTEAEALARDARAPLPLLEVLARRVELEHRFAARKNEPGSLPAFAEAAARAGGAWPARADLAYGKYYLINWRPAESEPYLERAVAYFDTTGEARAIFDASLLLAACRLGDGKPDAVEAMFARAEAQLARVDDARDMFADFTEHRAQAAIERQSYAEAFDWATKFVRVAEEIGDRSLLVRAYKILGIAAVQVSAFGAAERYLRLASTLCDELGQRWDKCAIVTTQGSLERAIGRLDRALARFEEAVGLACEIDEPRFEASAAINMAGALLTLERYAEAERAAARALTLLGPSGASHVVRSARVKRGAALRELGRATEALDLCLEADASAGGDTRRMAAADAAAERALTLATLGRAGDALASAARARAHLDAVPAGERLPTTYGTLARTYRLAGDATTGRTLACEGLDLIEARARTLDDPVLREAMLAGPARRHLLRESGALRV